MKYASESIISFVLRQRKKIGAPIGEERAQINRERVTWLEFGLFLNVNIEPNAPKEKAR